MNSQKSSYKQDPNTGVYFIASFVDQKKKETLKKVVENMRLPSSELATFNVSYHDTSYMGYVFLCHNVSLQQNFLDNLKQVLTFAKSDKS